MDPLKLVDKLVTSDFKPLIRALIEHRPVIHDFGDQRDPEVTITCHCKESGKYSYTQLGEEYWLHLFTILEPLWRASYYGDGR